MTDVGPDWVLCRRSKRGGLPSPYVGLGGVVAIDPDADDPPHRPARIGSFLVFHRTTGFRKGGSAARAR